MSLKPGWLKRQLDNVEKDIATWPEWMKPDHMKNKNTWESIVKSINKIGYYEDDWDGEGSPAPTQKVIENALEAALIFEKIGTTLPSRVIASVNSTIYFEFFVPGGYCEIEITEDGMESRFVPIGSHLNL